MLFAGKNAINGMECLSKFLLSFSLEVNGWITVLIFIDRCGSSLFNVNDDHRETSSDGQGEVGEVASTSAQASKFEDFQDQLHALDLYLLKYFKGMSTNYWVLKRVFFIPKPVPYSSRKRQIVWNWKMHQGSFFT